MAVRLITRIKIVFYIIKVITTDWYLKVLSIIKDVATIAVCVLAYLHVVVIIFIIMVHLLLFILFDVEVHFILDLDLWRLLLYLVFSIELEVYFVSNINAIVLVQFVKLPLAGRVDGLI